MIEYGIIAAISSYFSLLLLGIADKSAAASMESVKSWGTNILK
jgi:hypothetical protein